MASLYSCFPLAELSLDELPGGQQAPALPLTMVVRRASLRRVAIVQFARCVARIMVRRLTASSVHAPWNEGGRRLAPARHRHRMPVPRAGAVVMHGCPRSPVAAFSVG